MPVTRHSTLCLAAIFVAACDGGSGGSPLDSDASPGLASSVSFRDAQARTAFAEGAVDFTLSQPLLKDQELVCTLNGAAAQPCLTASTNGQIRFSALAPGLNRLRAELRGADGAPIGNAEHMLEVTTPGVVVFGATPGGIASAVAAARAGQTAVLLEPTRWVGGMMTAGLTKTDIGPHGHEILGGFAAEFFQRLRAAELATGACVAQPCPGAHDFESREAEKLFETVLTEERIIVERGVRLLAVHKEGATLHGLATSRGELSGQVFIDASYEGDLMALAGVPFTIGREPRVLADPPEDPVQLAVQEDNAGVPRYRIPVGVYVDPYQSPGDAASGTLPFVEPRPAPFPRAGDGDARVMAYTYRLCVTDDPSNRIPFAAPPGYDPARFEAPARVAQALAATGVDLAKVMFTPAPTVLSANRAYYKYDLNGGSTFSTDMTAPDLNQAYTEADDAERERIRGAYRDYVRGLLHFWQTDSRFGTLNAKVARFGYCRDEFVDRGGWPHQLYVRASRRMIGEYVMNENDVLQNGRRPPIVDVVGFGAYNIDMHTYRYHVGPVDWPDGIRRDALVIEGFLTVHAPNDEPYPVSYRALIPRAADAANLLNPITLSATHVAYSALRMEPTFMILGESAGIAAALAIETGQSVQALNYSTLRQRLLAKGQRLVN